MSLHSQEGDVVWLSHDIEGEIEEAELAVDDDTTIDTLRSRAFHDKLFPFAHGIAINELAIGIEGIGGKFQVYDGKKKVRGIQTGPKNTLILKIKKGNYLLTSRGSYVHQRTPGDPIEKLKKQQQRKKELIVSANNQANWAEIEDAMRSAVQAIHWSFDVVANEWIQTASFISIDEKAFSNSLIGPVFHLRDLSVPKHSFLAHQSMGGKDDALRAARARATAMSWYNLLENSGQLPPFKTTFNEAHALIPLNDKNIWYVVENPYHEKTTKYSEDTIQDETLSGSGLGGFFKGLFASNNQKHSKNESEMVDAELLTPALAHFVYESTQGALCVLLQHIDGSDQFNDCIVLSAIDEDNDDDSNLFGDRDTHEEGLQEFVKQHKCNKLCKQLKLSKLKATHAPLPNKQVEVAKSPVRRLSSRDPKKRALSANAFVRSSRRGQLVQLLKGTSETTKLRRSSYVKAAKNKKKNTEDTDDAKVYTLDIIDDFTVLVTLSDHKGFVSSLVLYDRLLFSGSADKTIKVWSLDSFDCIATLEGHRKEVTALWRTDSLLFSGSMDDCVRVWKLKEPFDFVVSLQASDNINGVCVAGNTVFAAANKTVCAWHISGDGSDPTHYGEMKELEGHKKSIKAMSAAGNYVFTGGNDKTIRVWDAKTLESKYVIDEHDGWIRHLSVFEKQLYSCSYDSSLKVWDLSSLACELTVPCPQRIESCCVWNDLLFVGCEDARMRVFNAESGESVQILKEHKTAVLALTANADLVFSGSFDNTIKVWGQKVKDENEDEEE